MKEIVYRDLALLKPNVKNPRKGTEKAIRELADSIKNNPDFFEARPILLSDRTGELVIIGGERRSEAAKLLGMDEVPTILIEGLTEAQEDEILIKDNTHSGEWVASMLKQWDKGTLSGWGVDKTAFKVPTETENLSEVKFQSVYYEPENKPEITLEDCVNMDKFNAKLMVIEQSGLSREQKNVMRLFAYRFLKIDFESVANYYAFNASDEEKEVMERLRLILVDDGSVDGFIEDEILRLNEVPNNE